MFTCLSPLAVSILKTYYPYISPSHINTPSDINTPSHTTLPVASPPLMLDTMTWTCTYCDGTTRTRPRQRCAGTTPRVSAPCSWETRSTSCASRDKG